ncbi:MAG: NAD(+)/NADH kinase [Bacteroidetes bacterium]|nr:NAD(+)/NADH kinase [Bacteroidota bacterium]
MEFEYAIIVKNKTRLETLVERFNTANQARFYIERSGGNWMDYEIEHNNFHESLTAVQRQLSTVIKNKLIDRSFLPSFLFNKKQLVIVIGQDGLVANTAKYVDEIPMVAVNPDVARYDGVLLPFNPENFIHGVKQVLKNEYHFSMATLAEAKLNDGQRILAFNELFIGASSHVSARYKINHGKKSEEHSSSGIIVSTKSGSSGWLSSIFNMTCGMNRFLKGGTADSSDFSINDNQLMFVVREPFLSKKTQSGIVTGLIDSKSTLEIESLMPVNGVIFSDGIESDFLNFNSGSIVTIGTAQEKAKIVLPR